jgi:putative membrane protein
MAKISAMTDAERSSVSAAVSAVERRTAGEVVTIVTQQSDDYAEVALLWSIFVAFLALAALALFPDFYLGIYDRLTGSWVQQWQPREVFGIALLVASLKFAGMWLLQLWKPLRLFLVPGPIKHERVRARAIMCFKVGAERRTHGRTGILIYISMAEHRAEIVADEAIAGKVDPMVWGEAMAAMLAHVREGRVAEGMVAAVEKVGAVLEEHFPIAEGDTNELPDRLIEV